MSTCPLFADTTETLVALADLTAALGQVNDRVVASVLGRCPDPGVAIGSTLAVLVLAAHNVAERQGIDLDHAIQMERAVRRARRP